MLNNSIFTAFLELWQKICFFCGSDKTKKNGQKRNKQTYKCLSCGRQFSDRKIDDNQLKTDYIEGKQTLRQLSEKHGVCVKTIWNHLGAMRHIRKISSAKEVVVLMDTTYWGRDFGLMIIKDAFRNKILWYKFVRNETVADYKEGVDWLREHDFKIYGIVCDGMRGLFKEFRYYRVQMCQFHQMMIVRRYLTNSPDLQASIELLALSKRLSRMDEIEFRKSLEDWYLRWDDFLKERTTSRGHSQFTHQNVRKAYSSIKYYMPFLWTCEHYPELKIPNTNAGIESLNAKIKTMLRVHSGISKDRRIRLIKEYIAMYY